METKHTGARDDATPPGWDRNPAAWSQRLPIVVAAFVGMGIATYMELYQLRVFDSVWDPFFGDGTRRGIAVSALSFVEGKRDTRYGGGWAVLWK